MIWMLRSQSHKGAIGEAESPTRRLFPEHLQAFAPPNRFHPLVIDPPALIPQQTSDPALPVAAILTCQIDDRGREGASSLDGFR